MTTTLPTSTFQIHESPPGPDRPDVTIALPRYNEQDHVHAERARIAVAMDASPFRYEIPAIDDASPHGTLRVMAFRRKGGSGLWLLGIGVVRALVDVVRFPLRIVLSTLLLIVAGLVGGATALLPDLIVRSRAD